MVDSDIPEEKIISVRDAVVPYMFSGLRYTEIDKIEDRFENEKYYWILLWLGRPDCHVGGEIPVKGWDANGKIKQFGVAPYRRGNLL